MATYLILNVVFLAVVSLALLIWRTPTSPSKPFWVTLLILLAFTALFDSLIISAGIVSYDESKLTGIFIGHAPVEDFFYAALACIIVPSVWRGLGKRGSRERKS
ncbi:lycopene cyclase domain-containing protein [Candidatus Saccharibacteria bacterium]|nr:lycopene cyclase domain-containing protein [Candidatus Saccharibacteria bacterium]NCS83048.1 lycopene cyclase domain-containing protein [Candidatus Saccharibacteria bacterium]